MTANVMNQNQKVADLTETWTQLQQVGFRPGFEVNSCNYNDINIAASHLPLRLGHFLYISPNTSPNMFLRPNLNGTPVCLLPALQEILHPTLQQAHLESLPQHRNTIDHDSCHRDRHFPPTPQSRLYERRICLWQGLARRPPHHPRAARLPARLPGAWGRVAQYATPRHHLVQCRAS